LPQSASVISFPLLFFSFKESGGSYWWGKVAPPYVQLMIPAGVKGASKLALITEGSFVNGSVFRSLKDELTNRGTHVNGQWAVANVDDFQHLAIVDPRLNESGGDMDHHAHPGILTPSLRPTANIGEGVLRSR
jgi:hypothetical protein